MNDELATTIQGIRRGLDQAKRGEGCLLRDFLIELATQAGLDASALFAPKVRAKRKPRRRK